jgi:hypothetical protein
MIVYWIVMMFQVEPQNMMSVEFVILTQLMIVSRIVLVIGAVML